MVHSIITYFGGLFTGLLISYVNSFFQELAKTHLNNMIKKKEKIKKNKKRC